MAVWGIQRYSLVEVFKFFGEKIDEKCLLFFTHFSPKKYVKNSKKFRSFSPPGENFEIKQEMSEKVLSFSHTFPVENAVKNNRHFSSIFSLKNLNTSTSARTVDILVQFHHF